MIPISENITSHVDTKKARLHIEVNDDVTSTQVSELRDYFQHALDTSDPESWTHLYLDLRPARVVDSMGINWMFAESLRIKKMNKIFVIRISSPALFRVMQFAGLDRLVTIKFRRRKQTR